MLIKYSQQVSLPVYQVDTWDPKPHILASVWYTDQQPGSPNNNLTPKKEGGQYLVLMEDL